MSINNDKHVDMNVDNYSPSELFQILDIQDPTKENIQNATDKMDWNMKLLKRRHIMIGGCREIILFLRM